MGIFDKALGVSNTAIKLKVFKVKRVCKLLSTLKTFNFHTELTEIIPFLT